MGLFELLIIAMAGSLLSLFYSFVFYLDVSISQFKVVSSMHTVFRGEILILVLMVLHLQTMLHYHLIRGYLYLVG